MVRKERGRNKGGGLAFLIHDTAQYTVFVDCTVDPHPHLAIKVNNLYGSQAFKTLEESALLRR